MWTVNGEHFYDVGGTHFDEIFVYPDAIWVGLKKRLDLTFDSFIDVFIDTIFHEFLHLFLDINEDSIIEPLTRAVSRYKKYKVAPMYDSYRKRWG